MDFKHILNQVLGSVQGARPAGGGRDLLMKLGGGAMATQLLSSLMRKKGGGLVRVGSMAALGALAYHAYQNWQRNQAPAQAAAPLSASDFEPAGAAAEQAGRVILRAMIAAAAADGEIDAAEQQMIAAEGGDDAATEQWLAQERAAPASPAELARDIGHNPALAAESYLAARMVCGEALSRKEIVFLSQLAQALNLDAELVSALEAQAGFKAD